MKLKVALFLLLSGIFVIGVSMVTKDKTPAPRTLPAVESAQKIAVAAAEEPVVAEDADLDWIATIDLATTQGSDGQLASLFAVDNLPATAKAHLIDAALQRQDTQLLWKAESLLYKMMESGSTADVLAAIPKIAYFAADTAKDIVGMQKGLCRFQGGDEFGFEMIKVKFNMVLGKEPTVRPWSDVCGAS